jgi:hypothetical protein
MVEGSDVLFYVCIKHVACAQRCEWYVWRVLHSLPFTRNVLICSVCAYAVCVRVCHMRRRIHVAMCAYAVCARASIYTLTDPSTPPPPLTRM